MKRSLFAMFIMTVDKSTKYRNLVNVDTPMLLCNSVNEELRDDCGKNQAGRNWLHGLTLEDLSQRMTAAGHPITKAALSKYELSKSIPRPAFLCCTCKGAGCSTVIFFRGKFLLLFSG